MKKKTLLMTALAIIGLTTFILPSLWAFDPPMAGGKWWLRPAIKDKLQLTLDQIEKINKIWIEHRKRIIDTKGEIEKAYLDLENLMDQPTVDKQEAYQLAGRLSQLQAQQTEARIKMTVDIRQELSVEQYDKLKGLRAELAKGLKEKGLRRQER
ncbi:MAG: periplasmic heavy metal sensor [Deltaproteobacteria bacterium]|nr:MAG: periplasmic heavy metal sensor [Deltaproteobacteria bacterium]